MQNFLLSTASQQEIAALDSKVCFFPFSILLSLIIIFNTLIDLVSLNWTLAKLNYYSYYQKINFLHIDELGFSKSFFPLEVTCHYSNNQNIFIIMSLLQVLIVSMRMFQISSFFRWLSFFGNAICVLLF